MIIAVIEVQKMGYSRFMNDKAKRKVDQFNQQRGQFDAPSLFLSVFPEYQNRPLGDILEEGMYDYVGDDPELVKMLNELVIFASPVMFDEEDVTVM